MRSADREKAAQGFVRVATEKFLATAGVRLLLGLCKWLILLHGAKTLPTIEFASLTAVLSLAEILRVSSDCGTESIIYARVRSKTTQLPRFVVACFQLRTAASCLIAIAAMIAALVAGIDPGITILLALIVVLSIASSTLIMLQRNFSRARFAKLVGISFFCFFVCVLLVLSGRIVTQVDHALLILIPEAAVAACAVLLARSQLKPLIAGTLSDTIRSLSAIKLLLGVSALGAIAVMLASRLDVWIVMPLLGATDQASYSGGLRFVEPANLLLAYASTAFLAELGVRNARSMRARAQTMFGRITVSRCAVVIVAQVLTGALVYAAANLVFGLSFDTSDVAGLLGAVLPIKMVSAGVSGLLYRVGRIDRVLVATLVNLGAVLALALALAPLAGIYGIAAAGITGEVLSLAYQIRALRLVLRTPGEPSMA